MVSSSKQFTISSNQVVSNKVGSTKDFLNGVHQLREEQPANLKGTWLVLRRRVHVRQV